MCELFGLCANKPVDISFSWRGFRKRGQANPDGWGVAWYVDEEGKLVGLVKEPRPAPESSIARLLARGVKSHIIVSHVRFASRGGESYVNTHPFVRKFRGRDWVFAHNGTVTSIMNDPAFGLRTFIPAGETDSEYAFCYILEHLNRVSSEVLEDVLSLAKHIWKAATKIGRHGKFNFLLSNGTLLFAFSNRRGTIHYLLRHPPHVGYARLLDEDFKIDLGLVKAPDEAAVLIATRKLTNENWVPLSSNELVVAYKGDIILRIPEKSRPETLLREKEREILCAVRLSPHAISLGQLSETVRLPLEEVSEIVKSLLIRGYLRKDSRYDYPVNHPESRYYTDPVVRSIIDKLLLRRD
ncbi:MAG: class II glutamine amidotransferase [Candidatus Njordarchaeales archaeon]